MDDWIRKGIRSEFTFFRAVGHKADLLRPLVEVGVGRDRGGGADVEGVYTAHLRNLNDAIALCY